MIVLNKEKISLTPTQNIVIVFIQDVPEENLDTLRVYFLDQNNEVHKHISKNNESGLWFLLGFRNSLMREFVQFFYKVLIIFLEYIKTYVDNPGNLVRSIRKQQITVFESLRKECLTYAPS